MKIVIEAEPEEIAAVVVELQGQHNFIVHIPKEGTVYNMTDEDIERLGKFLNPTNLNDLA